MSDDRIAEDAGLSIDMLDVDRLREWARLLLVHGADIGHWGSVPHVAGKLQIIATNVEKAVRDIGILRARAEAADAALARVQALPRYVEDDVVRRPSTEEWISVEQLEEALTVSRPETPRKQCSCRKSSPRFLLTSPEQCPVHGAVSRPPEPSPEQKDYRKMWAEAAPRREE